MWPPPARVGRVLRGGLGLAASVALVSGALAVGRYSYLRAKGEAAAVLIDRAWSRLLDEGRPHPPWPWADFTPIARIELRRLGIDRPVLSDATGRTLAFGLGHLAGSARPGGPGLAVVGGHRDTWAAFLAEVQRGDIVVLRTPEGGRRYRVTATAVVDGRDALLPASAGAADRLVLVTCWPFRSVRRGPLRYVVTCTAETPFAQRRVAPSVTTMGSSM
jgi:sortase A